MAVDLKLPSRGRILAGVIAAEDDLLLVATSAVLTLVLADMQRTAFHQIKLFPIDAYDKGTHVATYRCISSMLSIRAISTSTEALAQPPAAER